MAGKASVFAGPELFCAMEKLSKNTLIDMVVDRARAELGEDASDEAVANLATFWLGPVARARGDKPVSLTVEMGKARAWMDKSREKYGIKYD